METDTHLDPMQVLDTMGGYEARFMPQSLSNAVLAPIDGVQGRLKRGTTPVTGVLSFRIRHTETFQHQHFIHELGLVGRKDFLWISLHTL